LARNIPIAKRVADRWNAFGDDVSMIEKTVQREGKTQRERDREKQRERERQRETEKETERDRGKETNLFPENWFRNILFSHCLERERHGHSHHPHEPRKEKISKGQTIPFSMLKKPIFPSWSQ
jgi:hypothetical protein